MAEDIAPLVVWCFDRQAGTLTHTTNGMEFGYAAEWAAAGMPPLSQSLPLDGGFDPAAAAAAFFGGLLPEGEPRRHLARLLGVSEGNDYSLLAMIAGDTAGAITLLPQGQRPTPTGGDVEWLDDAGVSELLTGLPSRPMHVDADGEYRLSLAGAQDKLPVVVDDSGRIGLTRGQTPSTHIIKTPIARSTTRSSTRRSARWSAASWAPTSSTPQRSEWPGTSSSWSSATTGENPVTGSCVSTRRTSARRSGSRLRASTRPRADRR
ncbi:MAG TPA: HipA N-terminal domain-containing protein [Solirubrobacteraceae bacterium]|jgi:HipA-like protein